MTRSCRLLSVVACAVVGMSAAAARAQDFQRAQAEPYLLHGNRPVPGNGAIAIVAEADAELQVGIVGAEGVEVAGTVRFVEGVFWSWTPDEPMPQGLYALYLSARDDLRMTGGFEVLAPIERDPPDLHGTPSVSLVTEQIEVCCHFDDGVNLIWLNCSPLTSITSALLSPGLSSSSAAVLLNQYLFRYTERTSNTRVLLPWSRLFELVVPAAQERYCYELEAIDISTGAVHVYDDPDQLCAEASDFVPSSQALLTLPDSMLSARTCPIPPVGFEEQWCDVNAKRCGSARRSDDCAFYGHTCLGELEPQWGSPSDAGAPREEPTSASVGPRSDDCAVRHAGAHGEPNTRGPYWLALALLLARGCYPRKRRYAALSVST